MLDIVAANVKNKLIFKAESLRLKAQRMADEAAKPESSEKWTIYSFDKVVNLVQLACCLLIGGMITASLIDLQALKPHRKLYALCIKHKSYLKIKIPFSSLKGTKFLIAMH